MAAVAYELEVRPWIALVSQNVFGVKSKFAPAAAAAVHAAPVGSRTGSEALPAPGDSSAVPHLTNGGSQPALDHDRISTLPAAHADVDATATSGAL
jgi:hypothetical protein